MVDILLLEYYNTIIWCFADPLIDYTGQSALKIFVWEIERCKILTLDIQWPGEKC